MSRKVNQENLKFPSDPQAANDRRKVVYNVQATNQIVSRFQSRAMKPMNEDLFAELSWGTGHQFGQFVQSFPGSPDQYRFVSWLTANQGLDSAVQCLHFISGPGA
ncbi:hypothetical protein BaRGS_00020431, partial [Batillaria attramentaria]